MNPSANDIANAVQKINADNVFVFPNNKNIILAANQAKEMFKKASVHIIPTKNLMQCYNALSVITPGITDMDALLESIERAAGEVVGAEITEAVRDVTLDGKEIKKGDYISIKDGKIAVVAGSAKDAVFETLEALDMDDYEILTLFVGSRVSEDERAAITEELEDLYPMLEVETYLSGQEIYDYMISVV